jgi:hypothetical protein
MMKRVSAPRTPSIDCVPVLVQACSITASKRISKLARVWPPVSQFDGIQVYLKTRSIMASMFTQLWPASAYLETHSIMASMCISKLPRLWHLNSLDHAIQVYLHPLLITPSKLALSWPPSKYLQTHLVTAFKSIPLNWLDHGLQV